MLVCEAKGANQAQALILGGRGAVTDDDGSADEGAEEADFEDIRNTAGGWARRLWKPYRLHIVYRRYGV